MAVDMAELVADLDGETQDLEALLDGLTAEQWELATPAEGWAIRDQVSHLALFDEAATLSVTDPEAFRAQAARHEALAEDFAGVLAVEHRAMPAAELHAWFTRARREYVATFAALQPGARLPWYGADMGAASSVTARLMETWAHGTDVADALGIPREPTVRLRHVAHLGVGTRAWSFRLRGLAVPEAPVRVALDAPDGAVWTWGPDDALDRVGGSAEEFCLVVTQRRALDQTGLQVDGPVARQWLEIAQAFAGPRGRGRAAVGSP